MESTEPVTTQNEKAPQDAASPISAQGVRGDVLKTMLEQRACATPLPAASLNGPTLTQEQDDRMRVSADADLDPSPYIDNPNPPGPPPRHASLPVGLLQLHAFPVCQTGGLHPEGGQRRRLSRAVARQREGQLQCSL